MPKYRALRDTLLAHECRVVRAGEEFITDFPGLKNPKTGEVTPMRLGDNLELVEPTKAEPKGKGKPDKDDSLT